MTPYYARDLIQRLVAGRKQAGMTQADIGDCLGVTQTAISYWETCMRDMDLQAACAYAEAVGLELALRRRAKPTVNPTGDVVTPEERDLIVAAIPSSPQGWRELAEAKPCGCHCMREKP